MTKTPEDKYPKKIKLKIIWSPALMEQYYKQWGTYANRATHKLVEVNSKEEEEDYKRRNKEDVQWARAQGWKFGVTK